VDRNVQPGVNKRQFKTVVGTVALAAVLSACSSGGAGSSSHSTGGVQTFTVMTSNNGVQWVPIAAMAKDGIAAKHGLTVKLQVFQNGSGNSSLIFTGGTGDVLMGGLDAPVNFHNKNALNVTVVGAIEKENPFVLVAKSGSSYHTVGSLKGQTVGVSGAGSFSDYSVRYLLTQKSAMSPADIKTAALGTGPTQVAALAGGKAAAVMLQSPAYEQQQSAGSIQIVHNFREDGPMPAIVAVARTADVQKNPTKFSDFLAAWTEELTKMAADPAYALSAGAAYLGAGVTQSDLKIQLDAFLGGIWSTDGRFTQQLYDAGKSLLVGSGAFQESSFPSYADLTKGAPSPATTG
jgi:NitT/TauT family transport system substrate-binding protein